MKFFKRLIVLFIIAAFAVIVNSVKNDYSCDAGSSFPFSLLTRIFKVEKNTTIDSQRLRLDKEFSILESSAFAAEKNTNIKVTFLELGSVNCMPCRMMQPVMKQVEEKYGKQVKIIFHDVWTEKGKPYAYQYGIQAIPTQVFLDSNGKEYFRHVGFYSFEDVEKALKKGGVR